MLYRPEPTLTPPDAPYVTADCSHEVYDGEVLVEWSDAKGVKTLCPDCFRDKLAEMSIVELALQLGCDYTTMESVRP